MMYLKQATASQAVLLGPFLDSTDGVTAETALTIANTDILLSANGGTLTAKNSGGATHDSGGYYAATFDATDTATVGTLQVSVQESGALPVYHEFQVVEEAVYDALFASSAPGPITSSSQPEKNVALSDIPFYMVDDSDHVTPETGLTVTAEVSKDGAAFGAAGGTVTEIGNGVYHFDASQADMNADQIVFKFTATGADPFVLAISTR